MIADPCLSDSFSSNVLIACTQTPHAQRGPALPHRARPRRAPPTRTRGGERGARESAGRLADWPTGWLAGWLASTPPRTRELGNRARHRTKGRAARWGYGVLAFSTTAEAHGGDRAIARGVGLRVANGGEGRARRGMERCACGAKWRVLSGDAASVSRPRGGWRGARGVEWRGACAV